MEIIGPLTPERVLTVEQLLEVSKVNQDVWEVFKQEVNKRDWQQKAPDGSLRIVEQYQVKAWLQIKKALQNNEYKQELFDLLKKEVPKLQGPTYKDGGLLQLIILTDAHFDRIEHAKRPYLKEINDRFMRLVEDGQRYKPDKILFANLGDYFNSDTNYATTKGTPQHNYMTEGESFRVWLEEEIKRIKILQEIQATDVVYISWNHDTNKLQALADAIDIYFSGTNNINVNAEPIPRKYYNWGNNELGFAHWNNLKNKQIPLIFQQETKAKLHNFFFKGHEHHERKEQIGNVIINQSWSTARPSERERNQWHIGRSKIKSFVFDKKAGNIASFSR